ncbi:hypothetical protein BDB01DRAFT_833139 [Pilobolus umbonatus]|nr:hypothetical protein BDB01DRAFT_833139 [Pilobolus umbonatus]
MATKHVETSTPNDTMYRVKITNLPLYEMGSLKKLLQSHDLPKVKKAPKWDYAYLMFETEAAAQMAATKLNGVEFKKKILSTEITPISQQSMRSYYENKHKNTVTAEDTETRTPAERLADQVTPLHKLNYDEQLLKKHKSGTRQLNTLRKKMDLLFDSHKDGCQAAWTRSWTEMNCEFLDPIASPVVNGYRTKCEFTIGKDLEGAATVGFLLGLYKNNITSVLDPKQCLHIPDKAKEIAKAMEVVNIYIEWTSDIG